MKLTIIFIISAIITILLLVYDMGSKGVSTLYLNAIAGWSCAILWAIQTIDRDEQI